MRETLPKFEAAAKDWPIAFDVYPYVAGSTILRKEMLHEQDYSPWEGHEVHAWPALTVLRGKVAMENGELHATPSDGRYLLRAISEAIRTRAPRL